MSFESWKDCKIRYQMLWQTVPNCGCRMAKSSFSEYWINSVDLQQTLTVRSQLACRGKRSDNVVQITRLLSGQNLECYNCKLILEAALNWQPAEICKNWCDVHGPIAVVLRWYGQQSFVPAVTCWCWRTTYGVTESYNSPVIRLPLSRQWSLLRPPPSSALHIGNNNPGHRVTNQSHRTLQLKQLILVSL